MAAFEIMRYTSHDERLELTRNLVRLATPEDSLDHVEVILTHIRNDQRCFEKLEEFIRKEIKGDERYSGTARYFLLLFFYFLLRY